uniref:Vimentin n=1 Tax=Siphoviridae sp. ctj0M16 TaxID=2827918 RepID=A0A8S5S7A9_9CAUD|nr:MAG TPA: vimentin [Siphoviridae sp. ctj0M16]
MVIQKLLNRVAMLEYQNTLLEVENEELKKGKGDK